MKKEFKTKEHGNSGRRNSILNRESIQDGGTTNATENGTHESIHGSIVLHARPIELIEELRIVEKPADFGHLEKIDFRLREVFKFRMKVAMKVIDELEMIFVEKISQGSFGLVRLRSRLRREFVKFGFWLTRRTQRRHSKEDDWNLLLKSVEIAGNCLEMDHHVLGTHKRIAEGLTDTGENRLEFRPVQKTSRFFANSKTK